MKRNRNKREKKTLSDIFPESARVLLSGTGKQFIERLGVETIRHAIVSVMMGENLRTQTEPLSRRRIAQISGALVMMFARGMDEIDNFTDNLSELASNQMRSTLKNDVFSQWPAQWVLGLTGKSIQNVLRSDNETQPEYIVDFEAAIKDAAANCRKDFGDCTMKLGHVRDDSGVCSELDWEGITRLTTAIGCQTLTIRGSDKSMYGKLFERLILGSLLSILGFERVNPSTNQRVSKVFWLSDSSGNRESDATLLVSPGKLARFDIGFLGPGNSEISKDKLSRFAREMETSQGTSSSTTFIVVDRLPTTGKTESAANHIGAEIIQMSMQYWPRDLAQRLGKRFGLKHELQTMSDSKVKEYLTQKVAKLAVQDFVNPVL